MPSCSSFHKTNPKRPRLHSNSEEEGKEAELALCLYSGPMNISNDDDDFQVGSRVYYRPIRRQRSRGQYGTIVANKQTNKEHKCVDASLLVQLDRRVESSVRDDAEVDKKKSDAERDIGEEPQELLRHRLVPVFVPRTNNTQFRMIITRDTAHYRIMAESQLASSSSPSLPNHHVLEIGCSTGETSELLWRQKSVVASWVGLDTSKSMVERVLQRRNQFWLSRHEEKNDVDNRGTILSPSTCSAHFVDALADPEKAKRLACLYHSPTCAFLDIGGNRSELAVLKMLRFVCMSFAQSSLSLIVVKSRALYQAVETQIHENIRNNRVHSKKQLNIRSISGWIQQQLDRLPDSNNGTLSTLFVPKHPKQAPLRYSPKDSSIPICRYHNYHIHGCKKWSDADQDNADICPFDHDHCHFCLREGHIARDCPAIVDSTT